FRNKSSNEVALPHPESGQNNHRNKEKTSGRGVLREVFKRTVNVSDDWNGEDDVSPAKKRPFGGFRHDRAIPSALGLLVRLRRPIGLFNVELLGILSVQPLPTFKLHRIGASDAGDGCSAEQVIQHVETNVPARSAPRDKAAVDVVPKRQACAAFNS